MQHRLHAAGDGLLGSLCPGKKKLLGKTFYLDNVKKRTTALILETISLLGGGVESFLHKDVSFVVTGSQEYLRLQKCTDTKAAEKGSNDEAHHPPQTQESILSKEKKPPGTPRPRVCGSRGKALLEKAIRNNELHKSSALASAQSWGVKILFVDDVLLYLKRLSQESCSGTHKKSEKAHSKQGSHVVKAATLKSPYIKIEDVSRKYKPLHTQSLAFPSLWYSGPFSPFEAPPPEFKNHNKPAETKTREENKSKNCTEDKPPAPPSSLPSPPRPRRKELSYCECCRQHFSNLGEHLQSDGHRGFVLDMSNYAVVDQLVAGMVPGFRPELAVQAEDAQDSQEKPLTSIQDVPELEPVDDVEAERQVRALRGRGSSLCDRNSSPYWGPCASVPVSTAAELLVTSPKPPVLSPGVQALPVDLGGQIASSPVMPVLAAEARELDPSCQLHDTRRPFLSSDVPCPTLDPYSQPPVLSPQVLTEPHSPFSEPPLLSPKQTLREQTLEMESAEHVFHRVPPAPITTPTVAAVDNRQTQEVKGSRPQSGLEPHDSECPSSHLRSVPPFSRRSQSLPRQSTVGQNPKKRCRSASPGINRPKKRRVIVQSCSSGRMSETLKPGNHELVLSEAWLSSRVVGPIQHPCPGPQVQHPCPGPQVQHPCPGPQVQHPCPGPQVQHPCPGPEAPAGAAAFPGLKQTLAMLVVAGGASSLTLPQMDGSVLQGHSDKCPGADGPTCSQDGPPSGARSTSAGTDSVLFPDLAMVSSSSSDWDCGVLSRLGHNSVAPQLSTEQDFELGQYLLHRPRTWTQDSSYQSRLHTALQPSTSGEPSFQEDVDSLAFSRTVVKIVEVQH